MSQQVFVSDRVEFQGKALHNGNITGPLITKLKIFDCGFSADASESDWVSTTGSNGLTLSHSATDGGVTLMTLGSTNDDCGEFYHTAQWSAASNCGALFKAYIGTVTNVCACFGFVDAYENTNDHVAMEMNGAAAYAAANTKDYAGMCFDTDATTDVWYCMASENGTEATPVAAIGSLTPTAEEFFYIVVQTNTNGDVDYYYGSNIDNLKFVGHQEGAIASASTDLLTPYVGFITRTTAANTIYISRIITWQDN